MKIYLLLIMSLLIVTGVGEVHAAPILSGVDTLITYKKFGFDFRMEKACTSSTNTQACHSHFYFHPFRDPNLHYDIGVELGYGVKMGIINLDSLKIAPDDTVFQKSRERADYISPDSLFSRIGHSYFIQAAKDPRTTYSYFAKIRILEFKVLDSANRRVEMRFLWYCNQDGSKYLVTSGLDTFKISIPVPAREASFARKFVPCNPRRAFTVAGNRFLIPKETAGKAAYYTVYNLTGKKIKMGTFTYQSHIDLTRIGKGVRVIVIK